MKNQQEEEDELKEEKSALKTYAGYSGLAFQMVAIIGVFTFIGYKIDEWRGSVQPIFTALLSLLGVCVSLYYVVRSAKKIK